MRACCREPDPDTHDQAYGVIRHRLLIRHDRARSAPAGWTAAVLLMSAVMLPGTPLGAQTPPPEPLEVPWDWALIPSDLGPGDTFRLLFVTSIKTPLVSDSIDHYNAFVQGRIAAGNEAVQAYSSHFRVLASTAAVAARDNTGTNSGTDGVGEPIYWLGSGEKVADDYEDLYDESWDSQSWTTEAGGSGSDESLRVLNGSTWDGRSKPKWPFRNIATQGDRVGGGMLNGGAGSPMYSVDGFAGADGRLSARVYALSSVFQVAPDTLGPGGLYVADATAVEGGQTALFVVTMDGALPTFTLTLSNPANATLGDSAGTGTITDDDEAAVPLTAEFEDMPESHDGSAFTFGLTFSEEFGLSYLTLRDEVFDLTGGSVPAVQRKQTDSDRRWTITVMPDSASGAVTITLPETTDCDADGAICTEDRRPLSHSLTATVESEVSVPSVSVADASADEGDAVEFTVSLSAESGQQVTLDYATSGGTAEGGTDFTAASGTLTFAAGDETKTVSVATADDTVEEEDETFTLTLSNPENATLADFAGTGTITDDDEAAVPLTAEFEDMPESHDGSAFTFGLTFSEEFGLSYLTLRDKAFDVTGGSVTGAQRKQTGSDRRWTITVMPDSASGAVTITLPETTDCEAEGAICTGDDRPLSHSLTATVESEVSVPSVSVADASADEGDAVEFTVSLSAESGQQVTVDYATSGGTAEGGTDFTAASGTLTFAAGDETKTVSVATADDTVEEEDETFTFTLSNPANATLADSAGTGTITDDDEAVVPLTAEFEDMPESHDGSAFTFGLTFSEEFGLSYLTLRDKAFDVTGGSVTRAQRKQTGSNRRWTITVEPTSATDTVTITLPETTDCDAEGAICTEDDRPLSHSLSATVVDTASSSSGDLSNESVEELEDALAIADGVTPDEAAAALFGEGTLSKVRRAALDRLGNRNGRYDLGDMLSWIDRCRRGEVRCGGTPTGLNPASSAAVLAAPAGARGASRRARRRHDAGRRGRRSPVRGLRLVARMAGYGLAMLVAAAMVGSCTDGSVRPAAVAKVDPGFLTVELAAPAANRDIGVLLEVEGPGIETVRAPGLTLYQSHVPGRHQVIVAGSLLTGPLMQFRVPDRNQLPLYRVRVLQVTGEDYGLSEVVPVFWTGC